MVIFHEEHKMFREFVRSFIAREINPLVDQWETEGKFPAHELYKKMGNEGLLGLTYPEQYGGLALDFWYTVIWIEELGHVEVGGVPMSITVQTEISTPTIAKYGSHELKQQYLRPAILGDFIGALAITEPDAGSDVTAINTVADEYDDYYLINGCKSYITNGSIADFIVTLCKTSPAQGARGMSLLLVPAKSAGLIATQKYRKLGNFCCDHAELTFENVKVTKEHLIGMKDMGFDIQMEQFQHERLIEGILACSQAKSVLHKTKEYAKNRMIFGQRLIDHQSVAFSFVNMETELEFLQQMTYYCTDLFIKGHECTREIAMIKLKAGKLLRLVTDECLQLLGGYGYMEGTHVARAYRDGRATALTGGSVETMQHILTKFL
ncbi:MAG: acyl-CoA dehydrogenase family protein [Ktedonobacteraceae bacterium]